MRLPIVVAFVALLAVTAFAQQPAPQNPAAVTLPAIGSAGAPIGATLAPAIVVQPAAVPTGDYAGDALKWVAATFGTTIGAALTAWLMRLLKNAGVQGTELLRAKLQDVVVNGLNLAAKEAADHLQGKGTVEVKNEIAARAVEYAQQHGAETLKALGVDPTSAAAVEAIKARIETAINDPATPTPPAMDPAKPAAAVPPAA